MDEHLRTNVPGSITAPAGASPPIGAATSGLVIPSEPLEPAPPPDPYATEIEALEHAADDRDAEAEKLKASAKAFRQLAKVLSKEPDRSPAFLQVVRGVVHSLRRGT